MSTTDWSVRYLWLAILSVCGVVGAWIVDSTFVLSVAYVTIVAFALLALFHAYRLRTRARSYPQKIDRVP